MATIQVSSHIYVRGALIRVDGKIAEVSHNGQTFRGILLG